MPTLKNVWWKTTLSENDQPDTSELMKWKRMPRKHATSTPVSDRCFGERECFIIKQIASSSIEQAVTLRQKYNANKAKINELQTELNTWNKKLEDIAQVQKPMKIMQFRQMTITEYQLSCSIAKMPITWLGKTKAGGKVIPLHRKATMPNIKGIVTFSATVSIARKPKYFLVGHQDSPSNHSDFVETNLWIYRYRGGRILELNPDDDERKKVQLVNNRVFEIARQYPNCKVSMEYINHSFGRDRWYRRYSSSVMVFRPFGNSSWDWQSFDSNLCWLGEPWKDDALSFEYYRCLESYWSKNQ